ncbi:MAG TPA: SpoIIE family protein phosphatase [Anaerolineales bacterium]|nr:SpoIIE family protein phosphatase [Anaerolineales bacterium]
MTTDRGYILVVDDNKVNCMLLTRALAEQGHTAIIAENGQQALTMLRAQPFDMVLLDVVMPELDGYQTLAQIKHDRALRHIPVIMISSVDEMDSVIRCIEMGAEDYLPKPFNAVLLRARIGVSLEKKRLRDKEQLYLKGLERELEIGRQIQAGFLPDSLPQLPGWEIAARFEAAREVGGDFYDAFVMARDGKIGLVVADVCDKGVGAALFMTLFRSLIRATSNLDYFTGRTAAPGEADMASSAATLKNAVALTNNYIARTHSEAAMFATLFFGILDSTTGSLIYINGGQESPIIFGANGMKMCLEATGPAVGLVPDRDFAIREAQLEPGDVLLAFTDGVPDAQSPEGEFFGQEGLLPLLTQPFASAAALLDSIQAQLRAHIGEAKQFDDMTMLAVRRLPSP